MSTLDARPLPLHEWFEYVTNHLSAFLDKQVVVVSLIGRDTFEKRKGEDLNDLLGEEIFTSYEDHLTGLSIDALYSIEYNVVFLVVNGYGDATSLHSIFSTSSDQNFFERLCESEQSHHNLLLFVSVVSHIVLFIEQTCRFDMSLVRTLKAVNKIRISARDDLRGHMVRGLKDLEVRKWIKEGRLALPRFIFAFHRNTIRHDLGNVKKREIYEKLEQSLEQQLYNIFKSMRLVDSGGQSSSLGYMPEKDAYVYLITPPSSNSLSQMLNILIDVVDADEENLKQGKKPSSFAHFLKNNIDIVRTDKDYIYQKPSLHDFVSTARCVSVLIEEPDTIVDEDVLSSNTCRELNFIGSITEKHLSDAVAIYTGIKEKERKVFTKNEHDQRFASAVSYLESVLVGDRSAVMNRLRTMCEEKWERRCEEKSLTGHYCQLTMHPCVGDRTCDRSEWKLHSSGAKYVSTCGCGHTQALREDPFLLKEANFDFYHHNPSFLCCSRLEKFNFSVVDENSRNDMDSEVENEWAGKAEPRQFITHTRARRSNDSTSDKGDAADTSEQDDADLVDECLETSSCEDIHSIESEEDVSPRNYLDDAREDGTFKNSSLEKYGSSRERDVSNSNREVVLEHEDKARLLRQKGILFLDTVPYYKNALNPMLLPLYSSWQLTCLGQSSFYSHQRGLRDMPGFKPGNDYLLPWDVFLEVDADQWTRDMQYVQETVSTGAYGRAHIRRKMLGRITEKVKLFIGFEYECPRGHRMFIGPNNEPLQAAKGSAKDYISRDAASQVLVHDLPLWRSCNCRKKPLLNAQLMRIHIVTPKAPVSVTIQLKVHTDSSDEGYFHTGEAPLELEWSRYYILRLPFSYYGPEGAIIPPTEIGNHGTFKAECLSVTYNPLTSWIS